MSLKSLNIANKQVDINILLKPLYEGVRGTVYGDIINFKEESLSLTEEDFGNNVAGTWLLIREKEGVITFTIDINGGFRLYYFEEDDRILVSDSYQYILSEVSNAIEKNIPEYNFWLKHRYTTGRSTFVKGLNKINSASILQISNNRLNQICYFKNINRDTNAKLHTDSVHDSFKEVFAYLKSLNKKIILFFSGGKDSTLLLQYCIKYDLDFIPVYFKFNPITEIHVKDVERVRAISEKLRIELLEIEIDLAQVSTTEKEEIVNNQIFDKHFSLLHHIACKELKNKIKEEFIIINGQSSDSIFSFGPSENSLMSYFRRNILYKPTSVISKLGLILLMLKARKKFRLPKDEQESLYALLNNFKYTRVIAAEETEQETSYFNQYINSLTGELDSFYSKEMLVRISSYNQGADNHVVIRSAKNHSIKLIMPFAMPKIIYDTIRFKDETLEIKHPKYVIDRILIDKFNFDYDSLELNKVDTSDLNITTNFIYGDQMDQLFINKSIELLEKGTVHEN